MLNLYDLFLTDNQKAKDYGVDKVNPIFLNYIDTCSTKEIIENERLFYNRFSVMGDQNAGGSKNPVANKSREWIVNGDDVLNTTYEPVVKGADKFLYEPAANSYEFRPNNLADTQYEQVFFRDQNVVNQWNQVGDFFTNFFSSKQDGSISFNKEGTLLCAKYENNNWSFKSITSFDNVENQIVDIVKFYNPDYVDPNQQEPTPTPPTEETPPSSDGTTPPSDGTTDTTTPPPARANLKQTNKILVDDKNVKLVNNQYLINKKVD